MAQIFKILFETEDISIFVFHDVISVIHFQVKGSFFNKKNKAPVVESEAHFRREAVKV